MFIIAAAAVAGSTALGAHLWTVQASRAAGGQEGRVLLLC